MKKILLYLFALLLCPAWAGATDRYVIRSAGATGCSHAGTNYIPASNTCSGGAGSGATVYIASSQANLNTAWAITNAGDRLLFRAGTYPFNYNSNNFAAKAGTNFTTGAVTFEGYQSESVTFTTPDGATIFNVATSALSPTLRYIIFSKLILDGSDVCGSQSNAGFGNDGSHAMPDHIRYIDFETKNNSFNCGAVDQGGAFVVFGDDHEFIRVHSHHNGAHATNLGGTNAPYGFYMSSGSRNLIEYSEINNNGGYGIHGYSSGGGVNSNIYRFNKVYQNGVNVGGAGILISSGSGNVAYGNVVYGNYIGLYTNYNCVSCAFYNNTSYGNQHYGLEIGTATGSGLIVTNNIFSANPDANIINDGSATPTYMTNLCSNANTGCAITNQSAAATFTDPTNSIFTLKAGSGAIDAGTSLGSPYNAPPYNNDIANTTRPQPPGGAWDVGAYEAGGGGITPSCPGISPALVASYAFEDSTNDSTGNNHPANLGSGWTYIAGKYGRGVVSTGASGVTVADKDDLDICGGFTYEGWINLPNTSGDYAFIVKNPDSNSFLFASITYTCGAGRPLAGYSQDPIQVAACYGTPLTTGSFQHMAVTYDSTLSSANVKLYINGSLVTSADGTTLLDPTTGTLQFCTSGFGETCPSGTIIDEIQIYNYARDAKQIVNDMNTAIQVGTPTELKISGGTRRIGPGVTLRYGLKK